MLLFPVPSAAHSDGTRADQSYEARCFCAILKTSSTTSTTGTCKGFLGCEAS